MPDSSGTDPELYVDQASSRSVAWHCVQCGAYRIYDDATLRPAHCSSCGSIELASASPTRLRPVVFDPLEKYEPEP